MRRNWLVLVALLSACAERPAPGWKVVEPLHQVRGSVGGMIALRDETGELLLARSAKEALGEVPAFDSATAYRGGWLLTRLGRDGEFPRPSRSWFRGSDGNVVELERVFDGAAPTAEGIYLLQSSCAIHVSTQIYFARDLESDVVEALGPWSWLCAQSIAVDGQGRIWLVGSVEGLSESLWDVVFLVEEGRPRIVHHVSDSAGLPIQERTQLAIVDDVLYLSAPSDRSQEPYTSWKGIMRLIPTADGFHEDPLVPSDLRLQRTRERPDPLVGQLQRLRSMGVQIADYGRYDILPWHQPLDAIVDRLVEVVQPGDTVALTSLDADANTCPEDEALGRLPEGVVIEFVGLMNEGCAEAFFRRYPNLRR